MASILVLGGTSWLGGAVAAEGLARGHSVTCLARGRSGKVPPGATLVKGDRDDPEAYQRLAEAHSWDLVVDVARQPGHVRRALAALSERAANWAFVSSCSVYARHDEPGADESAGVLPPLEGADWTPEQYGEGKVACEVAVARTRGDEALVARSGLIVGAGDPSERFGYWPGRFALAAQDGGPVLVPADALRPVQWVDVLDEAAWIVRAGLSGTHGVFNVVGRTVPLQEVLDSAARAAGFTGQVVAASDDVLKEAGVEEFRGARSLPLWLSDPGSRAFMDRRGEAAAAAGLRQRPLDDTMVDALAWERSLGIGRPRHRAGIDRADELAVIEVTRVPRGQGPASPRADRAGQGTGSNRAESARLTGWEVSCPIASGTAKTRLPLTSWTSSARLFAVTVKTSWAMAYCCSRSETRSKPGGTETRAVPACVTEPCRPWTATGRAVRRPSDSSISSSGLERASSTGTRPGPGLTIRSTRCRRSPWRR